ncbi:ligand-binding sensor domain-containing protein [Petrocella sp. FN5]|uniref:ligand-binding sensor domain-containing protein n=1 Tax=Petrocella sp. FN5 TaxID=3032002 RepID=UPI0023D9CB63|nr:ligand-binding sensor domain-containing diguanylate cyclase [Petrocella sp. FN5]MDF1617157.1 diguanylate cyclase [Petrocella sp. FN5]
MTTLYKAWHREIISVLVLVLVISIMAYDSQAKMLEAPIIRDDVGILFERMGRESGLSNLSVSSMVQDKYGFLWFGTQSGLNRFDGREIMVYKTVPFREDGLAHNLVQTIYYDMELHELWVGTYQGVSHYIIHENRFVNYTVKDDNLSNPIIIAIEKDSEGYIWLGTMNGLNRLDPRDGSVKQYDIPKETVRALFIDSRERLLIGTYDGLLMMDPDGDLVIPIETELPSPNVMVIKAFEENVLTLGLWDGGVVNLDLDFNLLSTFSYSDNRVYSMEKTNDGTLWVGTWGGGLFATEKNNRIHHFIDGENDHALVHPIVYSMLQDDSGILWIGTNGGGISKLNPRKRDYVKFSHDPQNPDSMDIGKINFIFQDAEDNYWFAIYNNGLNKYNPRTETITKYKYKENQVGSLIDNQVMAMELLEDGRILVGTAKGLVFYNPSTDTFIPWNILPNNLRIYDIEQVSEHELWIGTYTNGLFYYNMNTNETIQYSSINDDYKTLSDNLVYTIHHDRKGRLWVGTNNGLNLLEKASKSFEVFKKGEREENQLANNSISDIFEDSTGRVWFGMLDGGVAYYDEFNHNFVSFTEEDGLSSNAVISMLEGNDNLLWIATYDGISILNPITGEIRKLTTDDGIGGMEFSKGHLKNRDGSMMFGGVHGITVIPKEYTEFKMNPPRLYITEVELFQEPIEEKRPYYNEVRLKFSPQENFLGFKFVALDYDSPDKIMFSYKLVGFDQDWIYAGTRDYASYSNLPSGDYQLMVVAEGIRYNKSEPVSVYFTIETPWYSTPIAYFIYVMLLILLGYGIFKIIEASELKRRNSKLAKINEKLEIANIELETLSIKDALTDFYNRRYLDFKLDEFLKLAKRSKTNLTLIMFDIDNFKDINDRYGHIAGDYYLVDVADTVHRLLSRSTDKAVRYGGDEFIIILYDNNPKSAYTLCEAIQQEISQIPIQADSEKEQPRTTISIGLISLVPSEDLNKEQLIALADQALYKAKELGKNQIYVSEGV